MTTITIRPARPNDRDAVLAFCQRTWDDGDYIESVWDEWLADPSGSLLVADAESNPVAIVRVVLLDVRESWIEGLRVAPDARRHGIGAALVAEALRVARARGSSVCRLFTGSDNLGSQALFAAAGFEQVARLIGFEAPARAVVPSQALPPGGALSTPGADEADRLWAYLEASQWAPLYGGLLVRGWRAQAMTPDLLAARMAAGEVWLLEAAGDIQALAIGGARAGDSGGRLGIRYLDGTPEGIGRLALLLRGEAQRRGLARVTALAPDSLILRDALAGAEYASPDEEALLCYARGM
ncbi:MAG TPA: GNAT family N-acetyltransferase [Ktedonobacterales bacterium]|nr:GNAT family N-acetyltransferase [Ktedonobacterales bacterium]